jgi:hypothetical protein
MDRKSITRKRLLGAMYVVVDPALTASSCDIKLNERVSLRDCPIPIRSYHRTIAARPGPGGVTAQDQRNSGRHYRFEKLTA